MSELTSCVVCGFPESVVRMLRVTWKESASAELPVELQMVVATVQSEDDVAICEDCIRAIKRIPFSDIH